MMHPSIIILLSALALVAASPVLSPRACATISPFSIWSIVNSQPDTTFLGPFPPLVFGAGKMPDQRDNLITTLESNHIIAQRQPGTEINPQISLQVVDFLIPAGANTCQMSITDQGKQLFFEENGSTTATPPALNIISLVPNADIGSPSYNSVMNATPSIIASYYWNPVTLSHGGSKMIGGFPCSPDGDGQETHARFVIEIDPNQIGPGFSDWILPQTMAYDESLTERSGVFVTYCLGWA